MADLISTKPDTRAKAAVLARARRLTDFRWTPLCDVPTVYAGKKQWLKAGTEVSGMPYSSTELCDKFIGENIRLDTMVSIMANPDSALYKKDYAMYKSRTCCYFGLVCNGLARYALNIRRRFSTKHFDTVPGLRLVGEYGKYTPEDIELCDVLYAHNDKHSHVALITDILRDTSGRIVQIEVSEAIRPSCVRKQYDIAAYFAKFDYYGLWRYDLIDEVPDCDEELDRLLFDEDPCRRTPKIAVDYGNFSNYRTYEEVTISVFSDTDDSFDIIRDGEVIETVKTSGYTRLTRPFDRGYYVLRLVSCGETVEFCVTEPRISYTVNGGVLTVKADSCDSDSRILYADFREKAKGENVWASLSKVIELTEEEKVCGEFSAEIPDDADNFKVYFENRYGIWTHCMIHIDR